MAAPRGLPRKLDVARVLLTRGSLFLHLDPRRPGVHVPPWLRAQPQVVLQVGFDMAIPIPDLEVDDEGVRATLSFQRTPFACVVPWSAVFALVGDDQRGTVWPEDLPTEIRSEIDRAHRDAEVTGEFEQGSDRSRGPGLDGPPTAGRAATGGRASTGRAAARPQALRALRDEPPAATPPNGPGAGPRPSTPTKKAKRPLPPYLRVVK